MSELNIFCRPKVQMMAIAMEIKLRKNDYKINTETLEQSTPAHYLDRAVDELVELQQAIRYHHSLWMPSQEDCAPVWYEAADVANFAMMAAYGTTKIGHQLRHQFVLTKVE